MNLEFKVISDKSDRYSICSYVLTWDTKKTYNFDNCIRAEYLFQNFIGVYNNNELIALGGIKPYYNDGIMCARLSSIVKPNFRRKGVADQLLRYMLFYSKNELNIEKVFVNIMKKNKPSILQIEKNDFNLISFKDNIYTYEKKLINN